MTVVCCWLDESYGRKRVTAIADSRAAVQDAYGRWTPLSDMTTKLHKGRIRCYELSALNTIDGIWVSPYYETEIGIAYSGYCFEAISIIALYQRCLEQLVADGDAKPLPNPAELTSMLVEITKRWYQSPGNGKRSPVDFLLFGFDPADATPWAAKAAYDVAAGARMTEFSRPLEAGSVYSIGDVGEEKRFRAAVDAIRRRIAKHAEKVAKRGGFEDLEDRKLEVARHENADKKSIEQQVLDELASEFRQTVGGVLEKAEVITTDDSSGVVSFSRNDQVHVLDALPLVGKKLMYMPISERMGWP